MSQEEKHGDKCCYWDDPEFCDCGEREINRLQAALLLSQEREARLRSALEKASECGIWGEDAIEMHGIVREALEVE